MAACEIRHLGCHEREILSKLQPHLMKFNTSSLSSKLGVLVLAAEFAFQRLYHLRHEAARFVAAFRPFDVNLPAGIRLVARTVAPTNKYCTREENHCNLDLRRAIRQRQRTILQDCHRAWKIWNSWTGL